MIDPVSLVVGAGVMLSGVVAGRLVRHSPRTPSAVGAGPDVPTCGCGHSMALHDQESKRCHGQVKREHYLMLGSRSGWEWVSCRCRRYLGPEHLADVWAPPITGTGG